jgi:hypothetical protein
MFNDIERESEINESSQPYRFLENCEAKALIRDKLKEECWWTLLIVDEWAIDLLQEIVNVFFEEVSATGGSNDLECYQAISDTVFIFLIRKSRLDEVGGCKRFCVNGHRPVE